MPDVLIIIQLLDVSKLHTLHISTENDKDLLILTLHLQTAVHSVVAGNFNLMEDLWRLTFGQSMF